MKESKQTAERSVAWYDKSNGTPEQRFDKILDWEDGYLTGATIGNVVELLQAYDAKCEECEKAWHDGYQEGVNEHE